MIILRGMINNMVIDYMKDILPVGSVVSIRFSKEKYMIIGFCTIDEETKKIYDYSAVRYPIGFESLNNINMFNKEVIKKIYHFGFFNDEHKEYEKKIKEALENKKMKDGI